MAAFSTDQFIELFIPAQAQIFGYIAALVPNRADADDLFQQTALVLWRKHKQFDPSRPFLPWAVGIAHNEVRRYFRSRNRSGAHLSESLMERLAEIHYASLNETKLRLRYLADCMARLDSEQRALLEQCYLGVDAIKDIAEKKNIAPATLYKRLDRIRWLLMDCIEATERREVRQ